MNIDFTKGMDYGVGLVKEFLDVIKDFFSWFNIDLFKADE